MAGKRGRSGKRPKPVSVLKLTGNFRPDRHKTTEVDLPVGVPRMPNCIKNNPVAKREWRRVIGSLKKTGCITHLDRSALVSYCIEYAKYISVNEKLTSISTMLSKTTKGTISISALVRLSDRAFNNLDKSEQKLGLTPLSRRTMRIEPKAKTEKSKFFEKKA